MKKVIVSLALMAASSVGLAKGAIYTDYTGYPPPSVKSVDSCVLTTSQILRKLGPDEKYDLTTASGYLVEKDDTILRVTIKFLKGKPAVVRVRLDETPALQDAVLRCMLGR